MSWQHKGYNIGINPDGKFVAVVGEENLHSATLEGMKEMIDKESTRKKRNLDIKAIGILSYNGYSERDRAISRDGEIVHVTITGIHRVNRSLLCKKEEIPSNCDLNWALPDTPEMMKLLLRCKEIGELQTKARDLLKQYRLDDAFGHHGRIDAADYDKRLDEVETKAGKSKDFTLGDQLIDRVSIVDTWAAGLRKDGEGKK